ncbi:hypothetical protein JBP901_gp193 [Bacillus phage JBP901]|uniref:DUF7349 domain-containing protein n=1 Tax=Bacillus phage JBP901 TaxID=1498212 RepID=A0A0E3DEP3_9CAUD|nr:hypothetical protein JBP901_gp193 [Bacillus phage JBP901]AID17905.1 hypothetical protein JBP901_gp193 [Bacillus phage JBP901]
MLEHSYLKNTLVATAYGDITFDEKGQTDELTVEQQKEIGALPGFNYVEPKAEPKKEVKKAPAKAKATAKKEEE